MIDPCVQCFVDSVIKSYATKEVITVSEYIHCDKKLTLWMDLPKIAEISIEDDCLIRYLEILGHGLNGIYHSYGDHNVFTEPDLIIKFNEKIIGVKVGILSKERWKQIQEKRSVK